ncbi:MAG: AAA family ATPase [Candidatus Bathyarchaeia archaeon]
MIKNLEIINFKSIKHLNLECKRINLFIGEPNTGKSNILETLALLSSIYHLRNRNVRDFIRFENMIDLYHDHFLENDIKVIFDKKTLEIHFKDGFFHGNYVNEEGRKITDIFRYDYQGSGTQLILADLTRDLAPFKFYRFHILSAFPDKNSEFLNPPYGDNLLTILLVNKGLRAIIRQIFERFGLILAFEPQEGKIRVQKQLEEIVISFPYSAASETLQRLVFYLATIYSNKDSVIAFEEPEAHAFPYYTKYLAENIAQDKNNNQYFISTHNPYFLLSILEKAKKDEVAVFHTMLEDYQTKVKALTEAQIGDILEKGIDVFFDLERFR